MQQWQLRHNKCVAYPKERLFTLGDALAFAGRCKTSDKIQNRQVVKVQLGSNLDGGGLIDSYDVFHSIKIKKHLKHTLRPVYYRCSLNCKSKISFVVGLEVEDKPLKCEKTAAANLHLLALADGLIPS